MSWPLAWTAHRKARPSIPLPRDDAAYRVLSLYRKRLRTDPERPPLPLQPGSAGRIELRRQRPRCLPAGPAGGFCGSRPRLRPVWPGQPRGAGSRRAFPTSPELCRDAAPPSLSRPSRSASQRRERCRRLRRPTPYSHHWPSAPCVARRRALSTERDSSSPRHPAAFSWAVPSVLRLRGYPCDLPFDTILQCSCLSFEPMGLLFRIQVVTIPLWPKSPALARGICSHPGAILPRFC